MGSIRKLLVKPRVFRLVVLMLLFLALLLLNRYPLSPTSPSGLHRIFLQSRHIRTYPVLRQPRCGRLRPTDPSPGPSYSRPSPLSLRTSHRASPSPCQSSCSSSVPILLLLAIKSHPSHFTRRAAIRATWGKERDWVGEHVSRVFLLGLGAEVESEVSEESENYGDILQWGFQESFFNVTLKEVLFWNWFQQECSQTVLYVLKGDDDVFVDVKRIVVFLQNREREMGRSSKGVSDEKTLKEEPQIRDRTESKSGRDKWIRGGRVMDRGAEKHLQPLYMGRIFLDTYPVRLWWNKYYVPSSLYSGPYPPYAAGGGYILCRNALALLHQASIRVPLFPIDDVFVGIVAQEANVSATHHPGFLPVEYTNYNHLCYYLNSIMVLHKLLPPDLLRVWSYLQMQGHSCESLKWTDGWAQMFSSWM